MKNRYFESEWRASVILNGFQARIEKFRRWHTSVVVVTSVPVTVVQAVPRQLQALDNFLGSFEQAEAQVGKAVVWVTFSVVKVAQNSFAADLDEVYTAAHS